MTECVLTVTSALRGLWWAGDVIRKFFLWGTGRTHNYSNSVQDRLYRCCRLRTSHPTALNWWLLYDNRLIILFNTIYCISKKTCKLYIVSTFWPVDVWEKQGPAWYVYYKWVRSGYCFLCCPIIIWKMVII